MQNHGILLSDPRPNDYILGGRTFVPNVRAISDWSKLLPLGESQRSAVTDMMDCVTFSAVHCIETQINEDIESGLYQQEALDYFQEAGYLQDGKFRASPRYNAVMNGTTFQGQYMYVAGDGLRTPTPASSPSVGHGLLPDIDMPLTPNMTWAEYYTQPTAEQIAKAKKIYDWMSIAYQWVPTDKIKEAIPNSPVQIAVTCCPGWNTDAPVNACTGPCEHLVMAYDMDDLTSILDHYSPFLKKLAPTYHIFSSMQYVVEPALPKDKFDKLQELIKEGKI